MTIGLTQFALGRHFDNPTFAGTQIEEIAPEELEELCNAALANDATLVDGYAPFCKHLFLQNTSSTKASVAMVTQENWHLLRSGYEARRESELPVLMRWFEGLDAPRAKFLDVILYSRAQLELEGEDVPDADWGIVSINAEMEPSESPIPPITMMRNALGRDEGGSGVALDREAYLKSTAFWNTHAVIR